MNDKTRTTESGARILKVLFALKGHSLTGLSNTDLARALDESPSTINRTLNTMIAEGAAEKLDNGRYRLGIKVLQIAQSHMDEVARQQARLDELSQRVSAGART
jgi:DNA-binding IclR family transcriptional regulator